MRKLKLALLAIFIGISVILSGCSDVERITDDMYLSSIYATHYYVGDPPVELTPGGAETDPVFTAWDRSTGISITESQISDLQAYAPLASHIFTGTVTIPTPFTLGATSVTTTGTQLNYLNAATGTTGTTSTNLVFSTSPSLTSPTLTTAIAAGTWTASGTWTIPAVTLGGSVSGNSQNIGSVNKLGIGTTVAANSRLYVYDAPTATAAYNENQFWSQPTPTANSTGVWAGLISTIRPASSYDFVECDALQFTAYHTGTGTVATLIGCGGYAGQLTNAGNITKAIGFASQIYTTKDLITSGYGLYIYTPAGGGAVTNAYGIYVQNQNYAGTKNYSLYLAGGSVVLSLPTSDPHAAGEVWNNGGVVTVSAG